MNDQDHEEAKQALLKASMEMMEMVNVARHGLDLIDNTSWGEMTQEQWDSIKEHARVIRIAVNIFGMSVSVGNEFMDDRRAMEAISDRMDNRMEICDCAVDIHFKGTRATCPQ